MSDKDDIVSLYKSTSLLVFNCLVLILTIIRLIVLLIYIKDVRLYVRLNGKAVDKYTILMFFCLTVSAVNIFVFRFIFWVEEIADIKGWSWGSGDIWRYIVHWIEEITKNLGWTLMNIGFLLNIYRWILILLP